MAVRYAKGCGIASRSTSGIAGAVEAVRRPEVGVAVVVLGLSPRYEGEEKDSLLNPGGDRRDIALPGVQQRLLEAVVAVGKPTVLVLTGGGALGLEWAKSHVPAILMAWYPGEEGGSAVADVLFGDANPAGRLPVTFYRSVEQLPPFEDYRMEGRTYRYFRGEPTYAFGFGRSFTTFRYGEAAVAPARAASGHDVPGQRERGEHRRARRGRGGAALCGARGRGGGGADPLARRLSADRARARAAGDGDVRRRRARAVDRRADGRRVVEPGAFTIAVGGGQPASGGAYASAAEGVTARLEVTGRGARRDDRLTER